MLRKLGISAAIAASVIAQNVNALGMGEIRVRSALNEPLYAEIQLLQVKNLSPLQIQSRLADLNDFALANLATQRALSDVRFQVRVNRDGTGRVILTSKLPVTEPFMNFLVEVNWPSGRLVREYTVLLDPPSYNNLQNDRNYQQPRQQPLAQAPAPRATQAEPQARPAARRATAPRASGPAVKPGQYYIRSKDTLWDIAVANKPDPSVSSRQMMVLIQRKNPQAFPSGNINMMKANQVIDLPTKEELAQLSASDASKEVLRQTRLWNAGLVPAIAEQPAAAPAAEKADDADVKPEMKPEEPAKEMAADKKPAEKPEMTDQKPGEQMSGEEKMMAAMDAPAKEEAAPAEKGVLNVVSAELEKEKMEAKAKAEAAELAASKDAERIEELLKNNAELDTKLALSQESIDELKRNGDELTKKLETMAKQLEDINRLIMLKDEQIAAFQQERVEMDQMIEERERAEREKSWLDKLLEAPVQLAALVSGWLFAIVAGVLLLLRRKKSAPVEDELVEKTEPSVSLPDNVIDEDLEELESLEELGEAEEPKEDEPLDEDLADLGEVDDLDLDLDLDMDLDLDESLEAPMVDGPSLEQVEEDDDLAAELDAQLEGGDGSEDDDLLEGIDSLDFDLGEVDELEPAPNMDEEAQAQALSELASVMDDEPETESDSGLAVEDLDIELAEELEEESEENVDEVLAQASEDDAFDAVEEVLSEGLDAENSQGDVLAEMDSLELPEDEPEIEAVSVEDMELDISELEDEAISLEDMEEEVSSLDEAELDLADEAFAELDELSLEDDLEALALEEPVEQALELAGDDADSLDSAAIEIEEEETIPMDDSLDDLLAEAVEEAPAVDFELELPDEEGVDGGSADELPVLEDEIDGLLNSTDDEIALEEVQPSADADAESSMDFLAGEDGVQMKLDLARAYVEMGDDAGAAEIIEEVLQDGDNAQREEAQQMLDKLKS